jgi:hypothetical protein
MRIIVLQVDAGNLKDCPMDLNHAPHIPAQAGNQNRLLRVFPPVSPSVVVQKFSSFLAPGPSRERLNQTTLELQ